MYKSFPLCTMSLVGSPQAHTSSGQPSDVEELEVLEAEDGEEAILLAGRDGDTLVDHPDDPGCADPLQEFEDPECDDGIDNDGDSLLDLADPSCMLQSWVDDETSECNDGVACTDDDCVDEIAADYVLTELGGWSTTAPDGTRRGGC